MFYKGHNIYFGDLHTHTGFSDGKLTPKEAFEQAKKNGNLDFMAVSDHAASMTPQKYEATIQAAIECTTPNFLALAACENGFSEKYENEYKVPVINGGELVALGADCTCSESENLEEFVDILSKNPNAFAGFAHPQEASWPTEFIWNGYDMQHHRSQKVLNFVKMIEVCNETSAYNQIHEKLYPHALDCGFHVSPTGVSDTHQANWGSDELNSRTAVIASELTQAAIFDALKNQRCYATETGNTLFDYTVNECLMGSTLPLTDTYSFHISIDETDCSSDQNRIAIVEIISDYGNIIFEQKFNDFTVNLNVTIHNNTARYFFIRVKNNRRKRIWSAPVWTGRDFDKTEELPQIHKISKDNFSIVSSTDKETAENLFNNNPRTPWRCNEITGEAIIDLGDVYSVCAIGYHRHNIPYEDRNEINSLLNRYAYYISLDGNHFTLAAEGIIKNYGSEQIHYFKAMNARYVKILARSSVGYDYDGLNSYPTIGEISIYC